MTLWLIPLFVLITSAISAALGMAGGLLLMGALGLVAPPALALALHGFLQLMANGYRAYLLRSFAARSILGPYALAALLCTAAMFGLQVMADRKQLYLLLGLVAVGGSLLAHVLPSSLERTPRFLRADRWQGAVTCAALVTIATLTAGVAGPLLDVFFLRTNLDRHATVATKAMTQSLSHIIKIAYVGMVAPRVLLAAEGWAPVLIVAMAATLVGSHIGGHVLDRMGERLFRRATRSVVLGIGLLYLTRGLLV